MSSKKRSKREEKKKKGKKKILLITLFIVFVSFILLFYFCFDKVEENPKEEYKKMYLASTTNIVPIYQLEVKSDDVSEEQEHEEESKVLVETEAVSRGLKVYTKEQFIEFENKTYQFIQIDGDDYYVEKNYLVEEEKNVVLEKKVYVRSATSILESIESSKIVGFASKGEELEVLGYEGLQEDGTVLKYYVKNGEEEGYVYGNYMSYTKEEALKNYQPEVYDLIHSKVKNTYGGGEAIKLDFYPNEKPVFSNNKMPDSVYALYLNCGSNTINHIDDYIEFAKGTNINAFVVDIKDNESPAYPAKTFEQLSPTNYSHAINSYDSYKNAITKLKEAGFYVIGRITTFKDSFYVTDHPENAIMDTRTGQAYLHNGSYWPSAYSRDVWHYTLSLAKEAVEEFGFHEINFDYVRFPDRMNSVSDYVDLKNQYNEDKTEAIQRFVQYAKDVLHELDVYVSIDVFGETTNATYTTAYGQYWPAISNVADVISGMPYPDHFSAGSYGLAKPWNNPYQLMNYWGSYANDRQKEIPTPAKVRTWIQAYDVMKYVDSNGISYGAKELEEEIRGLYEAGLTDGYVTWLANSNLEKYQSQVQAFQIDYGKEYRNE